MPTISKIFTRKSLLKMLANIRLMKSIGVSYLVVHKVSPNFQARSVMRQQQPKKMNV
jgi:hypothetical protein